jgi:hypothetical protein
LDFLFRRVVCHADAKLRETSEAPARSRRQDEGKILVCYGRLHFADPFFVDPRTLSGGFLRIRKNPLTLLSAGSSFQTSLVVVT